MKSRIAGRSISHAEVQNISPNGIWVLVDQTEYFLPYSEFPWFRKATLDQVLNLRFLHGMHLYWPDLDVDLELSSLKDVARYPLKYA